MNTNELLARFADSFRSELRTCLPAEVISFDSNNLTVDVQPLIQGVRVSKNGTIRQLETGERVLAENYKLSPLVRVPISILWFGDGGITMPISAGMQGLLLVCDRDIQSFKKSQNLSATASLRTHDLNDSFFLPFLPKKASISDYSSDSIDVRFGISKLKVSETEITSLVGTTEMKTSAIGVEITGQLIVNGINFNTHIHPYLNVVTPSTTGIPE
tara:strand:+ start:697 stop:1341 length:645 start_codon:yes stop_codon:yes gene_type:complete